MDTHLGYEKHETKAKVTPNSRNRKSKKTVVSEYGEQEITVPRDRLSEFERLKNSRRTLKPTSTFTITSVYRQKASVLWNSGRRPPNTFTCLYCQLEVVCGTVGAIIRGPG